MRLLLSPVYRDFGCHFAKLQVWCLIVLEEGVQIGMLVIRGWRSLTCCGLASSKPARSDDGYERTFRNLKRP